MKWGKELISGVAARWEALRGKYGRVARAARAQATSPRASDVPTQRIAAEGLHYVKESAENMIKYQMKA